jgi:hypothetical protein
VTPKENDILLQANAIEFKLAWLRAHPGRTRRDYAAGLRDNNSEVWQWRRAMGAKSIEAERLAWQADYPEIPYDHVSTCAAVHYAAEYRLFEAWQKGRNSTATMKKRRAGDRASG